MKSSGKACKNSVAPSVKAPTPVAFTTAFHPLLQNGASARPMPKDSRGACRAALSKDAVAAFSGETPSSRRRAYCPPAIWGTISPIDAIKPPAGPAASVPRAAPAICAPTCGACSTISSKKLGSRSGAGMASTEACRAAKSSCALASLRALLAATSSSEGAIPLNPYRRARGSLRLRSLMGSSLPAFSYSCCPNPRKVWYSLLVPRSS